MSQKAGPGVRGEMERAQTRVSTMEYTEWLGPLGRMDFGVQGGNRLLHLCPKQLGEKWYHVVRRRLTEVVSWAFWCKFSLRYLLDIHKEIAVGSWMYMVRWEVQPADRCSRAISRGDR